MVVLEVSRCHQAAQRGVCVINATTDDAAHCKGIKRTREWGSSRFSLSLYICLSLFLILSLSLFPSLFYFLSLFSASLYIFSASRFNYKTEYTHSSLLVLHATLELKVLPNFVCPVCCPRPTPYCLPPSLCHLSVTASSLSTSYNDCTQRADEFINYFF